MCLFIDKGAQQQHYIVIFLSHSFGPIMYDVGLFGYSVNILHI